MRSTFSHIVELLNAANKARDDEDDAPGDVGADDEDEDQEPKRKTKKKARPQIEEVDDGDERREDVDEGARRVLTPAQAAIIAQRIIAAGEQRRAEAPPELPTNRTARLIVLNGMRRRGEISDHQYDELARTSR